MKALILVVLFSSCASFKEPFHKNAKNRKDFNICMTILIISVIAMQ